MTEERNFEKSHDATRERRRFKGEEDCLEVTENDTIFDYFDSKSAGNAGTAVQVQEEVAVFSFGCHL